MIESSQQLASRTIRPSTTRPPNRKWKLQRQLDGILRLRLRSRA
jgi:hypothetical protein